MKMEQFKYQILQSIVRHQVSSTSQSTSTKEL